MVALCLSKICAKCFPLLKLIIKTDYYYAALCTAKGRFEL